MKSANITLVNKQKNLKGKQKIKKKEETEFKKINLSVKKEYNKWKKQVKNRLEKGKADKKEVKET